MEEKYYRYQARINGRTYTIRGQKSKEHMDAVFDLINQQIQQIKENSKSLSDEEIAILVAINAVSRSLDLEDEVDAVKRQARKLLSQAQSIDFGEDK